MDKEAEQKWNRIYAEAKLDESAVARVLQENIHLLPKTGYALDVACGMGANAVFLARQGLTVDAIDISDVAINSLQSFARANNLSINASKQDVVKTPIPKSRYDIVFVSHYLQRDLFPLLVSALKVGGLLIYQTFVQETTAHYSGPSNKDFRLAKNELLQLLAGFRLVVYREEGLIGNVSVGFRNEAMIIAQKI